MFGVTKSQAKRQEHSDKLRQSPFDVYTIPKETLFDNFITIICSARNLN